MKRPMKIRVALTALLAAAILFAAYYGVSALISPNLVLEKERGLKQYDIIGARAWAEGDAFHLGDSVSYFIEVKYDKQMIEGIDKATIDKNLVLEPFEIRDQSEKEFSIDYRTRVYLREYKIQLVSGEPGKTYFFPALPLRYKLKGSGYFDKEIILQPISVGLRFPADIRGIHLKSIEGMVDNKNSRYLPIMIVGLGIFCGAWSLVEIFGKIAKRRKEAKDFQKRLAGLEDVFRSYRALLKDKISSKENLHKIYQIMRTILSRKEGVDWTLFDWESFPQEIRCQVRFIRAVSQKAYSQDLLGGEEVNEALSELGKIFDFYVGKGEVR